MKLYPSLMCIDLCRLHEELAALDATDVAGYHIDIMDGNFVPNFALGSSDIKAVAALSPKELDIHLMVGQVDNALPIFLKLPAHRICFHYEAASDPARLLGLIREKGVQAGLAISPDTPVAAIEPLLSALDFVLVLSVRPGFAGQPFLAFTADKMAELCRIRREKDLSFEIEADGATAPDKIKLLSGYGVDSFVLGTAALFGKGRPYGEIIPELLQLDQSQNGA